ncbi:MAG: efflux RND transporter permease subunit [Pseudomonadota bacterium]
MISWFARNSVAANLLMISIAIGGLIAMKNEITLEVFPFSNLDSIRVSVPLRGATPEDVELGVAVRIEEAIQDLEGIEQITSTSREGATSVLIEVDSDYDPRDLLGDVKSRVDAINTFPADTENPVISLAQRTISVIDVVVTGDYGEQEIRTYAEQVRDEISRLGAVSQVELLAVRNYEIAIELSQDRLRDYAITINDVANAVRASSLDVSAGNVKTDGGDILIRSKGQAYRQVDFESIVVKTNLDGSIIRLGDIASVQDGFEETSLKTRFNGKHAALIGVSRVGKQSALSVAGAVKEYIANKQQSLPQGVELTYWDDDSKVLKNRLGILLSGALQGGLLVVILLTLFLRPAVSLWVFIGIPISFIGSFILISLFDVSINLMSAFGFIIVLGIVVDDAIVTGENVYRHIKDGDDGLRAAIEGTQEVAVPVTFGVLTTIAAFVPLWFVEGRLGQIFAPIPSVVIPVLLFSLIESKFVLPAHLKHIKPRDRSNPSKFQQWQQKFADGFEIAVIKYYTPILKFATENRYSTLASFIGVFVVIVALISSGWTKFIFRPAIEGETVTTSLQMPVGTPFAVTDTHIQRIADAVEGLKGDYIDTDGETIIRNVMSTTGAQRRTRGSHVGRVQFELKPPEERVIDVSPQEIAGKLRRAIGNVPGAESLNIRSSFFRPSEPIDIQFSGNSLATLQQVGDLTKQHLTSYTGVFEIQDNLSDGKEEIQIELTRQGHVLGLNRRDVANQVGEAFKGFEAQRIQRGRDDIRVIVRLPREERRTIDTLNEMLIRTPSGQQVPLANVATLSPSKGPSEITRIDRYRVLNVTADIDKENVNMTTLSADLRDYLDQMLLQYPSITYSMEGEAREQRESFQSLSLGLYVVLFAIYCLLALPLKSYTQPIIVMSVIPFGLIGATLGHWVMGFHLSIMSILGLMALIGVVVNDSLVLVDFVNKKHRDGGHSLEDAVLSAGIVRFRPVMLTSLTTFFGLLPLMLNKSYTAQFLIPMAISLGFGIIFATVITLILIPSNVLIARDIGQGLKKLGRNIGILASPT